MNFLEKYFSSILFGLIMLLAISILIIVIFWIPWLLFPKHWLCGLIYILIVDVPWFGYMWRDTY